MNAAIRSVVRTALARGAEPMGVEGGYGGLIEGKFVPLSSRAVAGILQRGGTFLGTARSEEFRTIQGQQKALASLVEHGVNCLIIVGGNGSLAGALALQGRGVEVAGIPATIDNDVWGTDYSIGADTALNTALLAIDRIKDTASSHHRAHVIEVMGRKCGYLALASGIAGGAEVVLLPGIPANPHSVIVALRASLREGKRHFIVVVAEGSEVSAREVHDYINATPGVFESRLTVLGHVQRGGAPTAFDRILASRLGAEAVAALIEGESGIMAGLWGSQPTRVPLRELVGRERSLDRDAYALSLTLASLPDQGRAGKQH
jgi:6-phosphofructokinase 1